MSNSLEEIFNHQATLTKKFHGIVSEKGLLVHSYHIPMSPSTWEGSLLLHQTLHWFNLEIGEALYASDLSHRPEEIIDALHFLVEFCLICGIKPADLLVEETEYPLAYILQASTDDIFIFDDSDSNLRFTILAALRVAEVLKNKPWKQSLREIDRKAFLERVRGIWYWWGASARTAGLTSEDVYSRYLQKNEENHRRIAGGV